MENREIELLQMLTYGRPSGGKTEKEFIKTFLDPLGTKVDNAGNNWLVIGNSSILWSSHTDTVHKEDKICKVFYGDGIASTESSCLGADCTVGVWLMLNMARNKIPGVYVWHYGEEVGGTGSRYIASERKHWLENIQYAIAFDRKGFNEIITHQAGTRCCSNAFGKSLSEILKPLNYAISPDGLFTDTANYTEIIPECTNISVGYHNCHSKKETLFIPHTTKLLDRLLTADWSRLVCQRDPTITDFGIDFFEQRNPYSSFSVPKFKSLKKHETRDELSKLLAFCEQYPSDVARYLLELGATVDEIEDTIWQKF